MTLWHRAAAALAIAAIVLGLLQLGSEREGLSVSALQVGSQPVTVFRPEGARQAPVVLVAHGFAGSQQLMQPLALALARAGFVAVTFDFPGHGRNALPMQGGIKEERRSLQALLGSMEEMRAFVLELSGGRPYAVLGHSMASDIIVRHAQAHPEVVATVAISLFGPSITATTPPDSPRNLLVIDGALEPAMMQTEALRVMSGATPEPALETAYGSMDRGTARKATLAPGVEHIGVLYSRHTVREAVLWLDDAFGRTGTAAPAPPPRGAWIALLLAGVVLLAWPLSALLPRVAVTGNGTARLPWWGWRGQAITLLLPALLTPVLLWKVPGDFLPILLGDYLLLHFGLYGLLTVGLQWLCGRRPPALTPSQWRVFALATAAVTAYALFAIGLPIDSYVFNLRPDMARLPLIGVMCLGTLPWFLADEWLTRAPGAPRGAYVASKLGFLVSLVMAIALNPGRLFFLAIIVPAILLLFLVYGLISRWSFAATGHPAVAGTANAIAFAWFVAVVFPLVS